MNQKRLLAAKALKTASSKIRFLPSALPEIQKAITKSDIRGLAAVGKILYDETNAQSRGRARQIQQQKRKGRQKGRGSKKGPQYSLVTRKERWINTIRAQRKFLFKLREKSLLSPLNYRLLYVKSKGGYFRNVRHIKLYLTEQNLIQTKKATMPTESGKTMRT